MIDVITKNLYLTDDQINSNKNVKLPMTICN